MTRDIYFRKRDLEDLPSAPSGKRITYHDTKVLGLSLRVTDAGTKTFIVRKRINGKNTRVTLGKFSDKTIEAARKEAQKAIGVIAGGDDPVAAKRAKRQAGATLEDVFKEYLAARTNLKEVTIKDYNRVMKEAFSGWKSKPLKEITPEMVSTKHGALGKQSKARANNAMRVLRALFNYSIQNHHRSDGKPIISANPVQVLSNNRSWYRVDRKQTVLKAHQLPAWMKAVMGLAPERSNGQASVVSDYFLFLLLTGLRRTEAAELQWKDVDLVDKTFTILDTKNRTPHTLPLSDLLVDIMTARREVDNKTRYVFAMPSGPGHITDPRYWMDKVTEESDIAFQLHDLRRTFTTVAESLDISAYALKRLLNHKTNAADVTAGYVVLNVERLRKPMQRITDYILKTANQKISAKISNIS